MIREMPKDKGVIGYDKADEFSLKSLMYNFIGLILFLTKFQKS